MGERAARLETLLESRPRRLRLPSTLEAAFRVHFLEEGFGRLRFGMLTGLLLFVAFAYWDVSTFPPEVLRWSLALRLGVACPLMALVLFATYRPWRSARLEALRLVATVVVGASVVAITGLAKAGGADAHPNGLFLVTVAIYTITGMRTPHAVAAGLSVLVMQIASDLIGGRAGVVMVEPLVFVLSANAIGCAAALGYERAARTSFLRMKLLECRADLDGLTGIANRRAFDVAVERALRSASREKVGVALAIFDVDDFKGYNDRLGHLAGDRCLQRIARATEALSRRPMDVAARVGGEEFAVLWYDASARANRELAGEIESALESLDIERPGHESQPRVTVSVGAVHVPPGEATLLEVLAEADAALYQAKRGGRARAVVRDLESE
jgi:diguanylate cyclase (GGDEF)-like protein